MSRDDLIAWRKQRGFTQVQAAKFLGYSERHYQRFEEGTTPLPDPKGARQRLTRIELVFRRLSK